MKVKGSLVKLILFAAVTLFATSILALTIANIQLGSKATYTALVSDATGVVDGQENPLAIISTAKLFEVQKFCSVTSHMWDGFWFLANKRAWERLPDDLRTIVAKNLNQAGKDERADVAKLNASVKEDLISKGMAFNDTDASLFRAALKDAGFYSEWKSKYGDEAWAILEKADGASLT